MTERTGQRGKDRLRPVYYAALELITFGRGLPVRLGASEFRLAPRWRRAFPPDYEQSSLREIAALLRPGDTAVDVGAHVGVYTLTMARAVGPGGQVVAFEPNPAAAVALRRHVALNGFQKSVELHPCALGEEAGTASLYTQENAAAPGSALYRQPGAPHAVTVPVQTLDALFRDRQPPQLIKLDVEGYERRVLAGARALLARARGLRVLCEVHVDNMPLLGETPEQLFALLEELGYAAFTLEGTRLSRFSVSGQYLFRRAD